MGQHIVRFQTAARNFYVTPSGIVFEIRARSNGCETGSEFDRCRDAAGDEITCGLIQQNKDLLLFVLALE